MFLRKVLFKSDELSNEKSRHIYWRQLVFTYYVAFLIFAGFPLAIIGALLFIADALYIVGIAQTCLFLILLYIVTQKSINFRVRVTVIVYFLNLIAYILMFTTGAKGAWIVFLMLATLAAGFLFDSKEIVCFSVINSGVIISSIVIILFNAFPALSLHEYHATWIVVYTSIVSVGIMVLLVVYKTISGIRNQGYLTVEREEYLEASIRSSHDGIVICDNHGFVTNVNPSAIEIFSNKTKVIGNHIDNIFEFIDEYSLLPIPKFAQLLEIKKGVLTHISNLASAKSKMNITISFATISSHEGNDIGMIFSIHDVTNQKVMEDRLKQTQKLQAMGTLAGGVAHDFNNMLGGILGYAQLLESLNRENQGSKTIEMNEYIMEIQKTVEKASELTRQLLAYARKEEILYQNMSLHSCIKSAVRLLNRTIDKRISIMLNLTEDEDVVFGDMTLLQNVFLNLCINARDAMPNGGQLIIQTRSLLLNEQFCNSTDFDLEAGEYLQIVFTDTGEGIDPKYMTKIFEPFFTTKGVGEGTGLGLSESYGTIVAHGGGIFVSSEKDMGTQFTIYIPKTRGEVSQIAEKIVESKSASIIESKKHKTLLIIDDEPVMRAVVELYFRNLGFPVLTADNGQEGIEIYKEKSNEIDVVLLDMIMPKLTGTEVFHKMKDIDENVKVIILSGFVEEVKISKLMEQGVCAYFKKPFRLEDIEEKINQL